MFQNLLYSESASMLPMTSDMNRLRNVGYKTLTDVKENGKHPNDEPLLVPGATITCRQLNYVIDVTPPGKLCGTIRKTILTNIR